MLAVRFILWLVVDFVSNFGARVSRDVADTVDSDVQSLALQAPHLSV